jgi:hypothetical protein
VAKAFIATQILLRRLPSMLELGLRAVRQVILPIAPGRHAARTDSKRFQKLGLGLLDSYFPPLLFSRSNSSVTIALAISTLPIVNCSLANSNRLFRCFFCVLSGFDVELRLERGLSLI